MTPEQQTEECNKAMKEYYEFLAEDNAKISKSIEDFLSARDQQFKDDFWALVEEVNVTRPLEIVGKAFGDDQDESSESFSKVLVNQRTGHLGDDFSGEIYALMNDGQWLKVSYEC